MIRESCDIPEQRHPFRVAEGKDSCASYFLCYCLAHNQLILQLIVANGWLDNAPLSTVTAAQNLFRTQQRPLLDKVAGSECGAYSNEADAFEVDFKRVFYGANYERLTKIKRTYDPTDLFIVQAGVGSERWDSKGLCRTG